MKNHKELHKRRLKNMSNKPIDLVWDDEPVNVTSEVNFIWSIANKLRGP